MADKNLEQRVQDLEERVAALEGEAPVRRREKEHPEYVCGDRNGNRVKASGELGTLSSYLDK